MELNGEEKIIRALFHEMKLEDERSIPTFVRVTNRKPSRPAPFHFGRVVLAFAVVSVILVLTLLVRQFLGTEPLPSEVTKELEMNGTPSQNQMLRSDGVSRVDSESTKTKKRAPKRRWLNASRGDKQLVSSFRRRKSELPFLSDWQSPTRAFLRFPGADLLKSLPQLNQSSMELGSFLNSRVN